MEPMKITRGEIKGGAKIKHPTKFKYYKKVMEEFKK
jgi:hypothetical protein